MRGLNHYVSAGEMADCGLSPGADCCGRMQLPLLALSRRCGAYGLRRSRKRSRVVLPLAWRLRHQGSAPADTDRIHVPDRLIADQTSFSPCQDSSRGREETNLAQTAAAREVELLEDAEHVALHSSCGDEEQLCNVVVAQAIRGQ